MTEPSRRQEAIHRVQIGLAGLLAMVVLIALASLLASNLRTSDAIADAAAQNSVPAEPVEPLADLGAAPAPTPAATQSGTQTQTIPDLKPDPKLAKPMDEEPGRAP